MDEFINQLLLYSFNVNYVLVSYTTKQAIASNERQKAS